MSRFDSYQRIAQGVVVNLYGDIGVWQPLAGGEYTALILFKEPTEEAQINSQDFTTLQPQCEYFDGELPGLFESVQAKQLEVININGMDYYTVRSVKNFDGKTIVLYLELKT
jgi:cellobiose-specific phosphotransferase system component IIB